MDRHKTHSNRHKTKEHFLSGCQKRKLAKEQEKKNEEVLAKTRRMTDFLLINKPTSSNALTADNTSKSGQGDGEQDLSTPTLSNSSSQHKNYKDCEEVAGDSVVREESPAPELQSADLEVTEPEPDPRSNKDVFWENDIGTWPKLMTSADVE